MGSDLVLCRSSGLLSLSGLGQVDSQDDFLARELHLHQGCLRHAPHKDGRVDGERRKGYRAYHGWQGVHLRWVQEGERQLPRLALTWDRHPRLSSGQGASFPVSVWGRIPSVWSPCWGYPRLGSVVTHTSKEVVGGGCQWHWTHSHIVLRFTLYCLTNKQIGPEVI